jgi:RNA polymerase sigma factor (sigma-70 family)
VDLVQETALHSLKHIERFEYRGEGALLAYLRQAVINRIIDHRRSAARRPRITALHDYSQIRYDAPSPLEDAIGREALDRYESALARLHEEGRQAIILRIELGHSYAEIAGLMNRPSADAARMLVARALVKLVEAMDCDQQA